MIIMELIKISGTPYERGYEFGKKFKDKIKACIKSEDKFWSARASLEQIRESAKRNEKIFESFAPELLEEIGGLGDGCGLEYKRLLGSTISSPYFLPAFCSAFVASGSLTKDGKPIMGRNVDWSRESRKHIRYVFAKPREGYAHICSRDLDSVGYYDGINEKGLAIAWAGVFASESEVAPGLLMFFITKLVLERCSDAEEAIKLIGSVPMANATNFIISDANEAAIVETTSRHRVVKRLKRANKGNFLVITNNFTSPRMRKYDVIRKIIRKKWPKAADPRIERYTKLIKEHAGLIDAKAAKRILSDHEGFICAHGNGRGMSETISSFIALPESKSVSYANGTPCKSEYFNFKI
jgi:isopenicillin-N N-acyltransferase-like protein